MQFGEVDYGRIIKAPLYDVERMKHGGFSRWLAGLNPPLLAALKDQFALGVVQRHFSFQQRNGCWSVFFSSEIKFRAANSAGNERRMKLKAGRFRPIKKV